MRDPRAPYGNQLPEMPPISDALVEALVLRFPVPIPQVWQSEREIWTQRGAWTVVEFLKSVREEQNHVHE